VESQFLLSDEYFRPALALLSSAYLFLDCPRCSRRSPFLYDLSKVPLRPIRTFPFFRSVLRRGSIFRSRCLYITLSAGWHTHFLLFSYRTHKCFWLVVNVLLIDSQGRTPFPALSITAFGFSPSPPQPLSSTFFPTPLLNSCSG